MRNIRHDPAATSPVGHSGQAHSIDCSLSVEELASRICERLRAAGESLQLVLQESALRSGLRETQLRVLETLSERFGSECTQTELAGRLQQSESHLSTLVERLADDGLLVRERSPRDRRKTLLRTTPQGESARQRGAAIRTGLLARLLQRWSRDELCHVDALLAQLSLDLASLANPLPALGSPADDPLLPCDP